MITKQHEQIISELKRITSNGNLKWYSTGTANEFCTNVGDYRITIFKLVDDGAYQIIFSDTVCAEISFIDKSGLIFDHIVVNQISGLEYQTISELHDLAKRSATGAENKLAEIITILQNND